MKIVLLIIPSFVFLSCSIDRKIYTSDSINSPAFKKKGNFSASATGGFPAGFDLNGSYALTNHFAIAGGLYSYRINDKEKSSSLTGSLKQYSELLYKHHGWYGSAGYYLSINKHPQNEYFSAFAGYTSGHFGMNEKLQTSYSPASGGPNNRTDYYFYKSDLKRWFLQGSYYYLQYDYSVSVTARLSYAGYIHAETDYTDDLQQSSLLPPFKYPAWTPFLDIAVNPRFYFNHLPWLGVEVYSSVTVDLRSTHYQYYLLKGGIGFCIRQAKRRK